MDKSGFADTGTYNAIKQTVFFAASYNFLHPQAEKFGLL